jgi:long-chain acyl-CoA synthetase
MTYRNLTELHRRQAERQGGRTALRYKRDGLYHDLMWDDYYQQALACAAALIDAGMRPGDRVGLVAENRVEWLIADMGILAAATVNVTPHAPLTARQIHFQLADAGVRWVFVSNQEQLDKLRQIRGELPEVKGVVVFDREAAAGDCLSWSGFLQRGRSALPRVRAELAKREADLGGDDLATIMYTSGTTGNPKGVMLTHANLISNAMASDAAAPRQAGAVLLNWLPFSHIYARSVDHYLSILAAVPLCLAESQETLVDNLREIQPTHFSCVPRFYEKLLAMVGSANEDETGKRLRAIFGPRIDWLGSGGAPLPPPIAETFHKHGLLILQGYGLTETSPVISFNRKVKYKLASVGQAIPGVEVKIAADGEVLARGPLVMKGYWKDPRATAETIRDGWIYTGDLGRLDDDGFLFITGRKKEMMVLSSGKKLVPPNIEGLILGDPCFDQVVVYGEGRNFITALVVPQWDNLRKELKTAAPSLVQESPENLAKNQEVYALLEKRIEAALRDVSSWERVKKFVVLPRPFTVAGDELTVSLKLRRSVIFAKHHATLDALYQEK